MTRHPFDDLERRVAAAEAGPAPPSISLAEFLSANPQSIEPAPGERHYYVDGRLVELPLAVHELVRGDR